MIQVLRVWIFLSVDRNAKASSNSNDVLSSDSNQNSAEYQQLTEYPSEIPTIWNQEEILQSLNLKIFSFKDLSVATKKFHRKYMLGQGSFGRVFKGWVDENTFAAAKWGSFIFNSRNLVIAVKRLNHGVQAYEKWMKVLLYKTYCVLCCYFEFYVLHFAFDFTSWLNNPLHVFDYRQRLIFWGDFLILIF